MPSCATHNDNRMGARRHGFADFLQVRIHGLRIDVGHDQSRAYVARWTDGSKNIGVCMPLVATLAWARSFSRPDARQSSLLPDAGFILEPDLDDFSFGSLGKNFGYPAREVFLKASWAF